MVGSDICLLSKHSKDELISLGEDPEDVGGYFIVNGSEWVIVSLEDLHACIFLKSKLYNIPAAHRIINENHEFTYYPRSGIKIGKFSVCSSYCLRLFTGSVLAISDLLQNEIEVA